MNRNYIDTHLAVDRYIRGALSADEEAEFEERLTWDQALMDEVDLAERLRDGLRSELDRNEPARDGNGGPFTGVFSFLQVPAYAAAASFLLAVGMTSFVITTYMPADPIPAPGGVIPTEIVPLFATRSNEAMTVTVSDDAWTVLLVDAPPDFTRFRVTVSRTDGEPVWARDDLSPTYPDSLAVGMPGDLLIDGSYVLVLDGMVADAASWQTVQEIAFTVRQPD